jgi:hypothetical protein
MRPRIDVPLSPADRATVARWARRVFIVWAFLAAALIAYLIGAQRGHDKAQHEQTQQQTQSVSHTEAGQR